MTGETDNNAVAQGEPNANSTTSTVQTPTSFDPDKFAADLEKRYSPESIEKLVQKHAHKEVDKLGKRVDEFQSTLAEFKALKAEGLTDAQAEDKMRFTRMEAKVNELSAPQTQTGSPSEGMASELALGMLKGLGLSDNDPEVSRALVANANNAAGLTTSLVSIYETRKNQPAPSPATIAQSTTGTTTATLTQEQIEQKAGELDTLLLNPRVNAAKISALQKELGPDYQ